MRRIFDFFKGVAVKEKNIIIVLSIICVVEMLLLVALLGKGEEAQKEVVSEQGNSSVGIDYGRELRVDIDGDGRNEVINVYDTQGGKTAYTQVLAEYANGDITLIDYQGTWASYMVSGDLNGDGASEIVVVRNVIGSTGGAAEISVLHVDNGEWVELAETYFPKSNIELEQPKGLMQNKNGDCPCMGATIIEKDGRYLLRVVYNGWDFAEDDVNYKDTVYYIDSSYQGDGWQIEDMQVVQNYYADKKNEEILDFSFIFE